MPEKYPKEYIQYSKHGERLKSRIHIWVPSFLDPEDIRKLSIGAIWNFDN
jgi:hypothetical protein